MKSIFLVRHAKSSWDFPSLRDIERPLNKRGLRDAPFMAKLLKKQRVEPDAIFSSPAVRALTTATFFKNELSLEGEDIFIRDEIYEAYPETIVHLIQTMPENFDIVMIFGHNPTFTSVANLYTKNYIGNVPTCGITLIEADVENWADFNTKRASLKSFQYPKQHLK